MLTPDALHIAMSIALREREVSPRRLCKIQGGHPPTLAKPRLPLFSDTPPPPPHPQY
jgi:hypothetical protein